MKIIKEFAMISGQDVFGKVSIHSTLYPELCLVYSNSPSIVQLPNEITDYIIPGSGWIYDGNSFIAPENYVSPEKDDSLGETGYAVILNNKVEDVFYPNPDTDLGQRYIAGLSSSPIVVEIPDDVYVLVGDQWDGEKFISEIE